MQQSRRGLIGAGFGLFAGGVAALVLQPTVERLGRLEATVASLDKRVSDLEGASGLGETPVSGRQADQPQAVSDDTWLTVSGTGNAVTDKFRLASGRYRVHAAMQTSGVSGFIAMVYGPNGGEDLVFNALVSEAGEWSAEAIYQATRRGDYFVEVSNVMADASWSLRFEPF